MQKAIGHVCLHSIGIVVPSKTNKYRPYALRHPVLAFLSFLIIAIKVATFAVFSLTPETAYLSTITSPFLIDQTNAARRSAGLPTLIPNDLLQQSAKKKGEDMLKNGYFAHNSPSGITPWKWFDDVDYAYVYAGENLAIDFNTGEGVHEAWMNSPGHRQNILNPHYRDIGIAVVSGAFQDRTTTIVIQHFGSLTAALPKTTAVTGTSGPAEKLIPTQPIKPAITVPPGSVASTPLPAPEIIEPIEGQILQSGAATVRGKSVEDSTVELDLNGKKIGSYLTVNGAFSGRFDLPRETQQEAKLTAFAQLEDKISKPSPERTIKIDTRGPSISPDSTILLPDPNGDATSVMLVVPVFGATKNASVTIGNQTIPLFVTGSIATGKISTADTTSSFTVRAEDTFGRVKSAEVFPLLRYQINPPTNEEKTAQDKLNSYAQKARELSIMLVYALALLLAINILIHLRIQHLDLIIHALIVLAIGTLLFLVT